MPCRSADSDQDSLNVSRMNNTAFVTAEKNVSPSLFICLILILLAGFVPLVVYFSPVQYTGIVREIFKKELVPDFFFYFKSVWLQILSLTGLVWYIIYRRNAEYRFRRPLIIYGAMCLLSTVFAPYRELAVWGDPTRFEGLFVQLSYVAVAFLFEALLTTRLVLNIVLAGMVLTIGIVAVLGFLQFLGYDYFSFCMAHGFLIPGHYLESSLTGWQAIKDVLLDNTVYLTFGNRNFSGFYLSMVFPFIMALAIGLIGKSGVCARLIVIPLYVAFLGCNARGAYVAGFVGLLIGLLFMRKILKNRWRFLTVFVTFAVLTPFVMDAYSLRNGYPRFFEGAFGRPVIHSFGSLGLFRDLKLSEGLAEVNFDGFEMKIAVKNGELTFLDNDGMSIPYQALRGLAASSTDANVLSGKVAHPLRIASLTNSLNDEFELTGATVLISESKLRGIPGNVFLVEFPKGRFPGYEILVWPEAGALCVSRGGGVGLYMGFYGDRFKVINQYGVGADPREIEAWGFHGSEGWGSGRGYIWARTLPLLKKTWLLGFGPDTFVAHFPQHDTLGKLKYWNSGPGLIFEKPHNHYLQIAVNIGGIGLIALLLLWGGYLFDSAKVYRQCDFSDNLEVVGVSILAGVMAYLVNSLFNDSLVGVAQLFWALLGMGFAVNRMVIAERVAKKRQKEENEPVSSLQES